MGRIFPRTGEHVIVLPSGEAIRGRTIHRIPVEDRWDPAAIIAVRALPRRPAPSDLMLCRQPGQQLENQADSGKDVEAAERFIDRSKLERPQVADQNKVPR